MCASNLHCKKTITSVAISLKSTVLVTTEGPKANRNVMGRDSAVCRRGPASAKQDGGLASQLQPCMPCMWPAHVAGHRCFKTSGFYWPLPISCWTSGPQILLSDARKRDCSLELCFAVV